MYTIGTFLKFENSDTNRSAVNNLVGTIALLLHPKFKGDNDDNTYFKVLYVDTFTIGTWFPFRFKQL